MLIQTLLRIRHQVTLFKTPPPTTPTSSQTSQPQSSTRISYAENPYTFEERHASLSEPLEPAIRQAPLSEPQYGPTNNIYPPLQQTKIFESKLKFNRYKMNRQIIHPRRNRHLITPRVQFNIASSPSTTPLDFSYNTIQSTPPPLQNISQQNTPNFPSYYLGSTSTSKQNHENSSSPSFHLKDFHIG